MTIEGIKQRQQERKEFLEMCDSGFGGATQRDKSVFDDVEFLLGEVERLQSTDTGIRLSIEEADRIATALEKGRDFAWSFADERQLSKLQGNTMGRIANELREAVKEAK